MEMVKQKAKPANKSQRRLPGWDYASPGLYFVTICTQKRQWFFGKVSDGQMHRNQMGAIAHERWLSIPVHHENVIIDAFIVMPNHIHGILYLMDREDVTEERNVATLRATSLANQHETQSDYYRRIAPKSGSLSTIIRSYKSIVTRDIRKNISNSFSWQARYYDHIIRTEADLDNLKLYIESNPQNWQLTPCEAPAHA